MLTINLVIFGLLFYVSENQGSDFSQVTDLRELENSNLCSFAYCAGSYYRLQGCFTLLSLMKV